MPCVEMDSLCEMYFVLRDAAPGERQERLACFAGTDPEMFQRLCGLLAADTTVIDNLIEAAANADDVPIEHVGPSIPGLCLLSVIGEGGFGVVYLAEQAQPIRRLVAVKVLRRELLGQDSHLRFRDECQAMAVMDHPFVASVLHWGLAPDGRPYIVMPLIPGAPISDYCKGKDLDPGAIALLMAKVVEGVEHAHSRGIIHRDLKPANIIVSDLNGDAVPRVIDFGLAKAVNGPLTPHHPLTLDGSRCGTLQYMSPEHVTAHTVDVRSDVFSLGLILRELLTGLPPYSQQQAELAVQVGSIRQLISTPLPPPSKSCERSLPRELDWIVEKATAPRPEERYQTAAGLRDDLLALVEGREVKAGPPARLYRLWSWACRNAVFATTIITIVTAIVLAGSVSAWMAARESRARSHTAQVAMFLQSIIDGLDPALAQGRDRSLVMEALRRATGALELGTQPPEVQLQICQLLSRAYLNVGEPAAALPFARRSRDIALRLFPQHHPKWFSAQLLYLEAAKDVLAPGQLEQDTSLPSRLAFSHRLRQEYPRGSRARALATIAAGNYAWIDDSGSDRNSYLRELHEDLKQTLGDSDRLTMRIGRWRARNLDPDHIQALAVLFEIREVAIRSYGRADPEAWAGLDMEGYHLFRAKGPQAAIDHLSAGIPDAERILGARHKTVVFAYENLGHALLRSNQIEEAEAVVRIALQRSADAYGKTSHIHALILGYWYTIQLIRGDTAAADAALADLRIAAAQWTQLKWMDLPEMILPSENFEQIILALDRIGRSERGDRICAAESVRDPDLVRRISAKRADQRSRIPTTPAPE